MAKKYTAYDRRRLERRNGFWPEASQLIYNRKNESGFCTIPRTLAMVASAIRHMSKQDPSRVYWDLWTRQRDDGFVEIEDPEEMAMISGLTGTRAVKSWREKLDELEKLGFIRIKGKGNQKYKFILLLHPHDVVHEIHKVDPGRLPSGWWSMFESRIQDIGAVLRRKVPPATKGDDFEEFPGALKDEDDDLPF